MASVKNYIDAGKALQEKYDEIKRGTITHRNLLQEHYKPLIEPLQNLGLQLKANSELLPLTKHTLELPPVKTLPRSIKMRSAISLGPIATKYLSNYASNIRKTDKTFGLHTIGDGDWYIGNMPLLFADNDIILPNRFSMKGSTGLWELLTMDKPVRYTSEDLQNYTHLVMNSNAYRQKHDPRRPVSASAGYKYKHIIKPMLEVRGIINRRQHQHPPVLPIVEEEEEAVAETSGSGLKKLLTNTPVEYVYWNCLEELLERLYIVYGEIKAGNTNPNLHNELVNILQEIREI